MHGCSTTVYIPLCCSSACQQLFFPGVLLQADTMVGTSSVLGSAQAKFRTVSGSCCGTLH
jgi:hypothetical protein